MSYGFGIGDFIAVGELCWKLYRDVYAVSKNAPAEVQLLHKELSDVSNVIKALVEDVQQPDSGIAQAGPDRIELTNNIMGRTKDILEELQELCKKFESLRSPQNGASKRRVWKQNWDRLKYAKEARTISDIRTRLNYQNGVLTLLLISSNNSSLERIKSQNEKLLKSVDDIKASIWGAPSNAQAPFIKGAFSEQFRSDISQRLMTEAESNGQVWSTIGIANWIQAGKWWLMKAQAHLYSTADGSQESCQAFADLLKASWILTDIISVHPQMTFITSGTQQLEIQHLSNVIRAEYKNVDRHSATRPAESKLLEADLGIWRSRSTTSLIPNLPSLDGQQFLGWKTASGHILFQKFGKYLFRATDAELECVILIEAQVDCRALNVIAQTFEGQEILRHDVSKWKVPLTIDLRLTSEEPYLVTFTSNVKNEGDGEQHSISFLNSDDARQFGLLLWYIPVFRSEFPDSPFNLRALFAGALLQYLVSHQDKDINEEDIRLLSEQGFMPKKGDAGDDLWKFASYAGQFAQRAPSFGDPHKDCGISQTVVSFICSASPTASHALNVFEQLVPRSSAHFANLSAELVQAAVYREETGFLEAVLIFCKVEPGISTTTKIEDHDAFVALLLRHANSLSAMTGPYILMWAFFQKLDGDLLNTTLQITGGSLPGGLERILEDCISHKRSDVCKILIESSSSIAGVNLKPDRLLVQAVRGRFKEGIECILAIFDKIPLELNFLLLMMFDVEIIRYQRIHGVLVPNLDLSESGYCPGGYDWLETPCFHSVPAKWRRSWTEKTLTPKWARIENMPCIPLTLTIFCAWDIPAIEDLLSGGAILGRDQNPEAHLPILAHLENCLQVKYARLHFMSTLQELQRLCRVNQETGSNEDWRTAGGGILYQLFVVASFLLGDDVNEPASEPQSDDEGTTCQLSEDGNQNDSLNDAGDDSNSHEAQLKNHFSFLRHDPKESGNDVVTEKDVEHFEDDQYWDTLELAVPKSASLQNQQSWTAWRQSALDLLKAAWSDTVRQNNMASERV